VKGTLIDCSGKEEKNRKTSKLTCKRVFFWFFSVHLCSSINVFKTGPGGKRGSSNFSEKGGEMDRAFASFEEKKNRK